MTTATTTNTTAALDEAGLNERLTAGARVADVACGTGHALVLLARAFPASTFGYDFEEDAIARAIFVTHKPADGV